MALSRLSALVRLVRYSSLISEVIEIPFSQQVLTGALLQPQLSIDMLRLLLVAQPNSSLKSLVWRVDSLVPLDTTLLSWPKRLVPLVALLSIPMKCCLLPVLWIPVFLSMQMTTLKLGENAFPSRILCKDEASLLGWRQRCLELQQFGSFGAWSSQNTFCCPNSSSMSN